MINRRHEIADVNVKPLELQLMAAWERFWRLPPFFYQQTHQPFVIISHGTNGLKLKHQHHPLMTRHMYRIVVHWSWGLHGWWFWRPPLFCSTRSGCGWPTPLKNDGVRQTGSSSQPTIGENEHVPNHQPEVVFTPGSRILVSFVLLRVLVNTGQTQHSVVQIPTYAPSSNSMANGPFVDDLPAKIAAFHGKLLDY